MVNPWAVVVAAVVSFLVGWLWYSPVLFGSIWMKASGISKSAMDKSKNKHMALTMFTGFVAQLVMAWVLAIFLAATGQQGVVSSLIIASWAWLGFVATIGLGSVLWEGKPMTVFWINMIHWLVALLIQAVILSVWM